LSETTHVEDWRKEWKETKGSGSRGRLIHFATTLKLRG